MDRVLACGASDEGSTPSGGTKKKSSKFKVQYSIFSDFVENPRQSRDNFQEYN